MLGRSTGHRPAAIPLAHVRTLARGKAVDRPLLVPLSTRTPCRRCPPGKSFVAWSRITPTPTDPPSRPNPHRARPTPNARAASRGFLPWRLADAGRRASRHRRVRPASTTLHRRKLRRKSRIMTAVSGIGPRTNRHRGTRRPGEAELYAKNFPRLTPTSKLPVLRQSGSDPTSSRPRFRYEVAARPERSPVAPQS